MTIRSKRGGHARRVASPPLTRTSGYRVAVPLLIVLVGAGTLFVLVLAGGVLFGLIPYPGR